MGAAVDKVTKDAIIAVTAGVQSWSGPWGEWEGMPMESISELSFEQAVAELERIVQKLEGEGLSLSETEALYERGKALGNHCQGLLEAVTLRVEQLAQTESGVTTVPFDVEISQ